MVTTERRKSLRYKFEGAIAINWGGTVLSGRVREIDSQGMFVEISNPLWIGATFYSQLMAQTPILLDCVVRWIEPGRGVGISIVPPSEEGRKRFAALIDNLSRE